MDYRRLGQTDVRVSAICLGTMTWGEQNTEAQAHAQLDAAMTAGVNFIDTAEMYPVPPRADTYGRTEEYIGSWLKQRRCRDKVVLATKVVGRSGDFPYVRNGSPCLDRRNIEAALHASLKRLQTDYVDLYQLHWPDRSTNYFGRLGYEHKQDEQTVALEETLGALHDLVKTGKIRFVGLSNETPWGVMNYLRLAEQNQWPRVATIQNPYNLLNRSFEIGLAEITHREAVGLLAYSPLGFGVLSGKYTGGARPAGARLTLFERFKRYTNPRAEHATSQYLEVARKHGLDPAQMALAYVTSRPFVTSNIIGATAMDQLRANLASIHLRLTPDVLNDIEAVHLDQPNPSP